MDRSFFTSSPISFPPDFSRGLGAVPEEVGLTVETVTYSQVGDV